MQTGRGVARPATAAGCGSSMHTQCKQSAAPAPHAPFSAAAAAHATSLAGCCCRRWVGATCCCWFASSTGLLLLLTRAAALLTTGATAGRCTLAAAAAGALQPRVVACCREVRLLRLIASVCPQLSSTDFVGSPKGRIWGCAGHEMQPFLRRSVKAQRNLATAKGRAAPPAIAAAFCCPYHDPTPCFGPHTLIAAVFFLIYNQCRRRLLGRPVHLHPRVNSHHR